jgi:hypothetical protein
MIRPDWRNNMHDKIQIITAIASLLLLGIILELIRKNRLREEYSIVWLGAGITFLVFSFNRPLVKTMADFMGIYYAPSALFVVAIIFGILIAIHFSLILSQLTYRVSTLAQANALMALEMENLKKNLNQNN